MSKGIVFKIKKYALHDGPGIRTTVFLKGCPLNCCWCHNPEGISPVPQVMSGNLKAVVGQRMSVEQVMVEIEKDLIFYDESSGGVTFSGGEPMMQPIFLEALLENCRSLGLHTAIDTSGYAPAETFARLSSMADLILFDIKLMDVELHRKYTGVDNRLILDNFKTLCRSHSALRVRLPLVPGMTDGQDNIQAVVKFLSDCSGLQRIDLLPYHCIGDQKYQRLGLTTKRQEIEPPSPEMITNIQATYERHGLSVNIGG